MTVEPPVEPNCQKATGKKQNKTKMKKEVYERRFGDRQKEKEKTQK
ncbi:hypothetical protein ACFL6B_04505 [Thermodesulfobacteriota bacterium]